MGLSDNSKSVLMTASKDVIVKAFVSGNDATLQNECRLYSNDIESAEILDTLKIIKYNLIKRIYTNEPVNANDDYETDYPNNRCIATQKALYESLPQTVQTELKCNYAE